MHRISQLSAIRKSARWTGSGVKWHFHLLSPSCLFNPWKMHAIVLESAKGNFVSLSHQRYLHIGAKLVKLLHGSKILEYSPPHGQGKIDKILQRAKQLAKRKTPWHHHLLFPKCIYNQQRGKWAIVFEDPLENDLTEIVYPHFPAKDLAAVEKLFYSQKK